MGDREKRPLKSYLSQYVPRAMTSILDQLLPPRCLSCGTSVQDTGLICSDCWKGLAFLQGPACDCCGYPFDFDAFAEQSLCGACQIKRPPYLRARAALRYDDGSRQMIISFKHGDRTEYAELFSQLMNQASHSLSLTGVIVAPVPLHKKRLRRRRYNQAALMAKYFADKKSLAYAPDLIMRAKHTPPQEGNYGRRKRNVAGAFTVKEKYESQIKGRDILLIDDVYTTGATVSSCAAVLRRAGASSVQILTLARVCAPSGK